MSKRYRLLKDINCPELTAKAGDIGVITDSTFAKDPKVWFDNSRYYFWLSTVESEIEWFEEVKEERIEVDFLGLDIPIPKCLNSLYSSHPIPKEKFPAIKEAIEQILNGEYVVNADNTWSLIGKYTFSVNPPETAAEKTDKDWEIVKQDSCGIRAVKRLSDGEVFTVGDEVIWPQLTKDNAVIKINRFTQRDSYMMVGETDYESFNLMYLQKARIKSSGLQDEYNGSRLYTQSELDKAVEDAFGAARKVEYWGSFPCHTHNTFSDYKAYLNTQKTKQ